MNKISLRSILWKNINKDYLKILNVLEKLFFAFLNKDCSILKADAKKYYYRKYGLAPIIKSKIAITRNQGSFL